MRNKEFSDRRGDAATAKAALLTAFKAAQLAAAPERAAKLAERAALAQAREDRRATREQVKREEELLIATQAAEEIETQRQLDLARAVVPVPSMDSHIARMVADEAARKAERDLRYTKRKAAVRTAA